ncbi:PhzF family phenazine biosynthesis protein [Clavibacter zhangzhiyongii]|uniref:PhzF family phenazine biosynthesis protein n=1 Tax=Clavibacter zhangzhiyongii TaxID=2768071 RepID=UPI0039E15509
MTPRPTAAVDGVRPDEVHVVRVFADARGRHGNELGIVLASSRTDGREPEIARALGFSETVFVDAVDAPDADPRGAAIRILTPARELPFAGHPTVGTAWWLASRGAPVDHLRVPAGVVAVAHAADVVRVTADPAWGPEFAWRELPSVADLAALDLQAAVADAGADHLYAWAWVDEAAGRSAPAWRLPRWACPRTRRRDPPPSASPRTSAGAFASRRAAAASWSRGCSTTAAPRSAGGRSRTG